MSSNILLKFSIYEAYTLYYNHCIFLIFKAKGLKPEEIVEDEEFFDIPTSTSPHGYPKWVPPPPEGKRQIPTVKFHVAKERKPELTKQQQKDAAREKKKDPNAPKFGIRQNKNKGKKWDQQI